MYIFEGRGKGATWSLLLEALHNQGVYIADSEAAVRNVKRWVIPNMSEQGVISLDGAEYLLNSSFSLDEYTRKGHRRAHVPIYFDLGMSFLTERLSRELGARPEVIALANFDGQVVHPKHFKEMGNTFVQDQRGVF